MMNVFYCAWECVTYFSELSHCFPLICKFLNGDGWQLFDALGEHFSGYDLLNAWKVLRLMSGLIIIKCVTWLLLEAFYLFTLGEIVIFVNKISNKKSSSIMSQPPEASQCIQIFSLLSSTYLYYIYCMSG